MKLVAALQIIGAVDQHLPEKRVCLCCGFTPLHLRTYLAAHLQLANPHARVNVLTGLFGDLPGNIASIPAGTAAVAVVEWSDLDPRLGFRTLGGWTAAAANDILESVPGMLHRLLELLRQAAGQAPVTLVLPNTPLAPVSSRPDWLADRLSTGLRKHVAAFAADAVEIDGVRLLSSDVLARFAGPTFLLKGELDTGFPYSMAFADFLAEKLAASLAELSPKKGLITDLDDTLWRGLVGEVGAEGLAWTLEDHAQPHGLYQQLLASLAEAGVLLAVASKNDPDVVEAAFGSLALAIKPHTLFPRAVHWGPKSDSVQSILQAWNIAARDVVFVDDSPIELEEVQRAFPEITCVLFKGADAAHSHELLLRLRNLFGKERIEAEDAIRAQSLRNGQHLRAQMAQAGGTDEFLGGLNATIQVHAEPAFSAGRALELINKTNQFNLNGRRYELAEWQALGSQPGRFLWVIEYADKHGSLGRIGVLSGVRVGELLRIDTWVLSCRAFSRRIEHATLDLLFQQLDCQVIELEYVPTPRNGPVRDLLAGLCPAVESGPVRLTRAAFLAVRPPLFHELQYFA